MTEDEKTRMRFLCDKFCLDWEVYGKGYPTMIKDCLLARRGECVWKEWIAYVFGINS